MSFLALLRVARSALRPQFCARALSLSAPRYNAAAALLDVVRTEAKIANEVGNGLLKESEDFLASSGFNVAHNTGESTVVMAKKLELGEEVTVFFDIDEITDVAFGAPEVPEAEAEAAPEEEDFYDPTFANIKVLVANPKSNDGLFFNLMLENSEEEFFVDYFNYKPDAQAFLKEAAEGTFLKKSEYQGPRFSELDEALQTAVEAYLKQKGVASELADFIYDFSSVKEEESYRKMLGDVSGFLSR